MKAQPEVIVRAAHQRAAPVDEDLGRPNYLLDCGVKGNRAVAKRGEPSADLLKLIEKVHQQIPPVPGG